MTILGVLLFLGIFGALVYLITLIPMPETIRTVIIVIALIVAIVYALQLLGVTTGLPLLRLR